MGILELRVIWPGMTRMVKRYYSQMPKEPVESYFPKRFNSFSKDQAGMISRPWCYNVLSKVLLSSEFFKGVDITISKHPNGKNISYKMKGNRANIGKASSMLSEILEVPLIEGGCFK